MWGLDMGQKRKWGRKALGVLRGKAYLAIRLRSYLPLTPSNLVFGHYTKEVTASQDAPIGLKKKKMLICTAEFTKGKYRQYSKSHFLKTYLPSI